RTPHSFPTRRSSDLRHCRRPYTTSDLSCPETDCHAPDTFLQIALGHKGLSLDRPHNSIDYKYPGAYCPYSIPYQTSRIYCLSWRSEEHTSELQSREN